MIAYSKKWLCNLHIHSEADEAFHKECISEAEQTAIKAHYPVGFYTPNFFIRIGLFILTAVIASFTLALFFLITFSSSVESIMTLLFFFTTLSYGALEFFVRQKHHFRSGVDDALLWVTVLCFLAGLSFLNSLPMLGYSVLLFILSGYLALRFADTLMSALVCLSGFGILFYSYLELGTIAKFTMPFVVMAAAAALYFWLQGIEKWTSAVYYRRCLLVARVIALLSFYAAGNYFVVRELSNSLFELNLMEGEGIPLGWLFWALTVGVPLLYMYRGAQSKDPVLLRVGLLLIAVMVFTIRYYHHIMPLEIAMIIGGMVMIAVAYGLIHYLRQPRRGFTYKEEKDNTAINKLEVEALVINQTFGTPQAPEAAGTRFGGGSGGGAGASGHY
jgi:hypothetical protein